MSDILPFYFTLTIHLMAILMVVSAIQFIGVACLMNHVILLLRPLKMKDWLLCGIKSNSVNKMNFASDCNLSTTKEKDGECFLVHPLNSTEFTVQWSVTYYTAAFKFILHQQRSEDVVSYYSMLQTGQDAQKTVCCRAPHFIITEKHTQGFFMILDYSFLRTRDIAQILEKSRRVS